MMLRAAIATGLALCLAVVPVTSTHAASPSSQTQPLPTSVNPIAEVVALHEAGMARFEAAAYDEALILWKRAFVLLPHDPAQQPTRAVMVANIVAAHRLAYEASRNSEHLFEAIRLIDIRKAEIIHWYKQAEVWVNEWHWLDARRGELVRRYDLAILDGEFPSKLPAGTAFRIEHAPPLVLTRQEVEAAWLDAPDFGSRYRRAKGLADSGILAVAVGSAFAVATILSTTAFQPKDGTRRDVIPIAVPLGAVALGGVIVGGALWGVGNKRKHQVKDGYRARQRPLGMVAPLALPRGGGLGFVGHF